MFVRTERLTLRPGWIEDAPDVARAIGHEAVCAKLAQVPFPYTLQDARDFLASQQTAPRPPLFMFEHAGGTVRLVGCIGLQQDEAGDHELGYWLTPDAWGRGYATEAGHAVVRMARESLRLRRLVSGHFIDNPASGRVLRKLGFRPTGRIVPRYSKARGADSACATFELDLCSDGLADNDPRTRMAA
ncbi:MAG: GNAT family N-acetyltransferase [Pseudomonadota bacterium]